MKIRVLAAVLDTANLTLYHEDGNSTNIPQGDKRVRIIIDQITPILTVGGVAEVELSSTSNTYSDFQEKTSGLVRFFCVAKKAVAGLFGGNTNEETEHLEPREIRPPTAFGHAAVQVGGSVEKPFELNQPAINVSSASMSKMTSAIDDIMAHAVPVTSVEFSTRPMATNETIIAVVDDKIIPGIEKIKTQVAHSTNNNSTEGVQNFLRRLGAIISDRSHTVDELLTFVQNGDLPLSNAGDIIAYKVLNSKPNCPGFFVDCHTGKITQRVGSFVCMDDSLIDQNRRNECSTGLHIARRAYIRGFKGDVITLVKIAPEDVIAVPPGEPNKMRVRGYHILALLPKESYSALRNNKAMTENSQAGKLLGMAIRGEFSNPVEEVRVAAEYGGKVIITPLTTNGKPVKKVAKPKPTKTMPVVAAIETTVEAEKLLSAPVVNPKAVVKEIEQTKAVAPIEGSISRTQKAVSLENRTITGTLAERQTAARELLAFKKQAKVGWHRLGLPDDTETQLLQLLAREPEPEPKPAAKPVTNPRTTSSANRMERAQALYRGMTDTKSSKVKRREKATELVALKKFAKVSWDRLGVPNQVSNLITQLLG